MKANKVLSCGILNSERKQLNFSLISNILVNANEDC